MATRKYRVTNFMVEDFSVTGVDGVQRDVTSELSTIDNVTAGMVTASKAVVVDGSKNITGFGAVGCGAYNFLTI